MRPKHCERKPQPQTDHRYTDDNTLSGARRPVSPCGTRMSIRSRECPNQMREVDVLTMRHPRCAPEFFYMRQQLLNVQSVPPAVEGDHRSEERRVGKGWGWP